MKFERRRSGLYVPKRQRGFITCGPGFFASQGSAPPPAGITARYWQLNILSTQNSGTGSGYINCSLIGLNRAPGDMTNQCASIGGTATQSSVLSGLVSINAWSNPLEDGTRNPSGYWHSNNEAAPWWTIFDCGAGKTITASEIALCGTNIATRMPTHFQLLTSDDNVTWTNVLEVSGIPGWVSAVPKFFTIPS